MRILWLDPGVQTGVALYDTQFPKEPKLHIVEGGLKGLKKWYQEDANRFAGYHLDVLGYESFEAGEGEHGLDLTPVEIIGWIKGGGMSDNYFEEPVSQRRTDRRQRDLLTDAVLKRAGLYPPRGQIRKKHQVEAFRHLLRYLISQRHLPTIALLHPKE